MGVLFLLVIQAVIFGFFCSYIAKEKNRDSTSWFWLGFCFSILAIFALIAVPKVEGRNSSDSLRSPTTNAPEQSFEKSEFRGERNISSPAYQLFLTRLFAIEKNITLDKYVIGDDVFSTLEDSLCEANSRYEYELTKASEANELALQEKEKADEDYKNRAADNLAREAVLAPARARRNRIVLIGLVVFLGVVIATIATMIIFSKNAREAKLKADLQAELEASAFYEIEEKKYSGSPDNKKFCVEFVKRTDAEQRQLLSLYARDCKLIAN